MANLIGKCSSAGDDCDCLPKRNNPSQKATPAHGTAWRRRKCRGINGVNQASRCGKVSISNRSKCDGREKNSLGSYDNRSGDCGVLCLDSLEREPSRMGTHSWVGCECTGPRPDLDLAPEPGADSTSALTASPGLAKRYPVALARGSALCRRQADKSRTSEHSEPERI